MNKIEDQIKKFETIKEKIPTTLIPSLIKEEPSISNSLLFYFFKKTIHMNLCNHAFLFTILAGTPATVQPGSNTDLFTTAFAPIFTSSAISISPIITAP